MDLYETLGVARDATKDAIKKAFRAKAKQAHPDAGGEPEKFHAIEMAHRVLTDDARRAEYDRTGATEAEPDNFDAAALSIIGTVVDRFLADEKAKHKDLIAEIRKTLTDEIRQARGSVKEGEKYKARTEDCRRRTKSPLLVKMMDAKLRDVAVSLDMLEKQIGVREHALDLLKDASFDFEKMSPQDVFREDHLDTMRYMMQSRYTNSFFR